METQELVKHIVRSLDTHKASEIRVLRVTDVTPLAHYYIIAAGSSTTQVRALADYAEFDLAQQGVRPLRTEGYQTSLWTLLDYGEVIVHLFLQETRKFYDLERLWQDSEAVDLTTLLENGD